MAEAQLSIRIDLGQPSPAYRQIGEALRTDHLPPVRELALELGIHHNDFAQADRQLWEQGWLDLKRRPGGVVLEREAPRAAAPVRDQFRAPAARADCRNAPRERAPY